jgi:hypothetical protein
LSNKTCFLLLIGGLACSAAIMPVATASAAPFAIPPYTLKKFPGIPPKGVTAPDDLAISADGSDLWVGYGNGHEPDGSDGLSSNVIEYDIATGKILKNIPIKGHTDGLKIKPATNQVWTTQNEDANPTLAIITQNDGRFTTYGFVNPTAHGGGFDDLVFAGQQSQDVFLSASNPSGPPFTNQAIAKIVDRPKNVTEVSEVIAGDATAYNVATGEDETLAISDSDSMTLDPAGELVLDSQGDDELIVVRAANVEHPVLKIPLTMDGTPTEVNDTIFTYSATNLVSSTAGVIFITDTNANAIYTLTKPYFPANEVYTAADAVGDIGLLDMNTGNITPVVTGLEHPNGLAFSPTLVAIASDIPR